MAQRVRNSKGFSLIELMISILIIMVTMLALLTSIVTSIKTNSANETRNTAIRVTNETAEALLALPIDDNELSVNAPGTPHQNTYSAAQKLRGFPNITQPIRSGQVNFTVTWDVAAPTANLKQINIAVAYLISSQTMTRSSTVYKHRAI